MRKADMRIDQKSKNYNRIAKWYNAIAAISEKSLREEGLQQLNAKEGEVILEIGFGTGHNLIKIAEAVGNSGKVYGIDISSRMFEITEARIKASCLTERIDLRCGDALRLPYPEKRFNGLFMSFILETLERKEMKALLNECRRVIRLDGRICIVAMSNKGRQGIMMKLYEWAHEKFPQTIDCRPINIKEVINSAGLNVIKERVKSFWGLSVEIVESKRRNG